MNKEKWEEAKKKFWKRNSDKKIIEYYHKPVLGISRELKNVEKSKEIGRIKGAPNKKQKEEIIERLKKLKNMARRIEYKLKKELENIKND